MAEDCWALPRLSGRRRKRLRPGDPTMVAEELLPKDGDAATSRSALRCFGETGNMYVGSPRLCCARRSLEPAAAKSVKVGSEGRAARSPRVSCPSTCTVDCRPDAECSSARLAAPSWSSTCGTAFERPPRASVRRPDSERSCRRLAVRPPCRLGRTSTTSPVPGHAGALLGAATSGASAWTSSASGAAAAARGRSSSAGTSASAQPSSYSKSTD
mmetsp:Transcript_53811/g.156920  ORF Transcript_53811/g.156920 Transcript_53811/m.156920 type:complete len:214 (+) Transcript_53811:506-1147(+)